MTASAFDTVIERTDTALIVVTVGAADQRAGCVVGFHTQCSIDPVRYAVWVSKANHTYRVALFATHLGLHFPDAGDRALVELFGGTSGDDIDKFAHCQWTPGPGGVPLLTGCATRVVLRRTSLWDDGSDHVCIVGEPVEAEVAPGYAPLRLSGADDVDAGHAAEERPLPADLEEVDPQADQTAPAPHDSRHELEELAAGAGHAVDLSAPDPDADR
ncbi:MAG: flavin reductase family protein [Ilumatobacteraceae bacterium]